jgi:hypothetical protein
MERDGASLRRKKGGRDKGHVVEGEVRLSGGGSQGRGGIAAFPWWKPGEERRRGSPAAEAKGGVAAVRWSVTTGEGERERGRERERERETSTREGRGG